MARRPKPAVGRSSERRGAALRAVLPARSRPATSRVTSQRPAPCLRVSGTPGRGLPRIELRRHRRCRATAMTKGSLMKARDIMSHDTQCVRAGDTLEAAAQRLADAGVGAMPICGDDDRLKGMLTDRDIVVKAIAKGKDVARTLVSELAEGKPVTIGADDSISETLKTMERAQVRRLPVIDGHRLVGIISSADIARRLPRRKSGELLQELSK